MRLANIEDRVVDLDRVMVVDPVCGNPSFQTYTVILEYGVKLLIQETPPARENPCNRATFLALLKGV